MLNLADHDANPPVHIHDRGHEPWAEAIERAGDDRHQTWKARGRDRPLLRDVPAAHDT